MLPFTTEPAAGPGARTVYVTRHAQTTANAAGVVTGWNPGRLTPAGRAHIHQARQYWRNRPIHWVVASPLGRATATAQLLFGRVDDIDAAWVEQATPALDGLPVARAHRLHPELCRPDGWARRDAPRHPGSEHLDTVAARALVGLRNAARSVEAGQASAVVTHGALVATLLRLAGHDVQRATNLETLEMQVDPDTGWRLVARHDPLGETR